MKIYHRQRRRDEKTFKITGNSHHRHLIRDFYFQLLQPVYHLGGGTVAKAHKSLRRGRGAHDFRKFILLDDRRVKNQRDRFFQTAGLQKIFIGIPGESPHAVLFEDRCNSPESKGGKAADTVPESLTDVGADRSKRSVRTQFVAEFDGRDLTAVDDFQQFRFEFEFGIMKEYSGNTVVFEQFGKFIGAAVFQTPC